MFADGGFAAQFIIIGMNQVPPRKTLRQTQPDALLGSALRDTVAGVRSGFLPPSLPARYLVSKIVCMISTPDKPNKDGLTRLVYTTPNT